MRKKLEALHDIKRLDEILPFSGIADKSLGDHIGDGLRISYATQVLAQLVGHWLIGPAQTTAEVDYFL